MKKAFLILFNILIIIILYFIIDFIIYKTEVNNFDKNQTVPKFSYNLFNPKINYDYLNNQDYTIFRKPSGLEYSSSPITIFGCSVGYGQYLNDNQTFSYYLSEETKRPVYNRSISGGGLQNMYYQVVSDEFYSQVPYSSDVIYVYINDHIRRMLGLPFNILERNFYLHYKLHNGKLIKDNYDSAFLNFLRSSYILNRYKLQYFENIKKSDYIALSNEALEYFLNTKYELKYHWGKDFHFYVLFFIKSNSDRYLIDLLKQNGFEVILIEDLTSENLHQAPYLASDNKHPSEEVWKLITPKIAQILSFGDY